MEETPKEQTTTIVARCLEEFQEKGEAALERACRQHPELAARIRRSAGALRELLVAATAGEEEGAPADWSERRSIGRFQIGEEVGRGGMGIVYRAFDPRLERRVALKILPAPITNTPEALARFRREGQTLAKTDHPNIIPVHEVGETEDGIPYLVMRLVEGRSLSSLIADIAKDDGGKTSAARLLRPDSESASGTALAGGSYVEAVVRIVIQIADALEHAHGCGVIHRDVKPGNILVDRTGHPYLVDFGIARGLEDARVTHTGTAPGTPAFMAPEQIESPREVGPRTDVYALGATLYHCLTLRTPFEGQRREQVFEQVRRREPLAPRRINAEIPKDLETVCLTAMEKDPARRYESATELAQDLERFLEFRPVRARPLGRLTRFTRLIRRNRLRSAVAALSALLVVGGPLSFALHEVNARARVEREKEETEREHRRAERAGAESLYRVARLAAQRGDWGTALVYYGQADEKGYPDPVETAIGKIEALEGNLEAPRALAMLEELSETAELGKHRGRILLLEADLAVNRILDPDAKLDLVRKALELGDLSLGDEEFARAMLSDTVDEALAHLRKARAREPWHRRVNDLFGGLLIVSGRMEELSAFARILRSLYPEDPSPMLLGAFATALRGDRAGSRRLVGEAKERLGPRQRRWIRFMLECAAMVREYDRITLDQLTDPEAGNGVSTLLRFVPFLLKASSFLRSERTAKEGIYFRVAPVASRGYHRVLGAMVKFLFSPRDIEPLAAALGYAADHLGDGVFHFGRGQYRWIQGREAEAVREFEVALSRPSLVLSRRTALFYLLEARVRRFRRLSDKMGEEGQAIRVRIARSIGDCLAETELEAHQLAYLFRHACRIGRAGLAAEIALRWQRRQPDDAKATAARRHALDLLSKEAREADASSGRE